MKLIFPDTFSKNTQISIFMKIRPVGDALLHAGRRTDMTKVIDAFLNFTNAPKQSRSTRCNDGFQFKVNKVCRGVPKLKNLAVGSKLKHTKTIKRLYSGNKNKDSSKD
jgi:hypothetical protein